MAIFTAPAAALTAGYRHIYLSPHLDDAALSCGGAIAQAAARGEPTLVVNLCSGSPPADAAFSPFAELQHTRWGLPAAAAVARRRDEEAAALAALGADGLLLAELDAIYRWPEAYHDEASLFGAPDPADPLGPALAAQFSALAARYPRATFYAPLAVGGHVDHRISYAAAAALAAAGVTLRYYEDYPYAGRPGAVAERLAAIGAGALGAAPVAIDGRALAAKIAAIAAYASQLGTLFGGAAAMPAAVTAYAASVAAAEGLGPAAERRWVRR